MPVFVCLCLCLCVCTQSGTHWGYGLATAAAAAPHLADTSLPAAQPHKPQTPNWSAVDRLKKVHVRLYVHVRSFCICLCAHTYTIDRYILY